MTREERNNKLKQFITCLKCEVSGKPCDGNCSKNYEVGNMGEIIENLEAISKALEQEPKMGHWIDNMDLVYHVSICSNCNWRGHGDTCLIYKPKYCPNCGAKMEV